MLKALRPLALLMVCAALAGTAHAQTPAPTPAPAAPTPAKPSPLRLAVPSNAASSLGIEVSGAVKGRLVGCPKALKLSSNALCFYVATPAATLRSPIKTKLGTRAGEWKMAGKASSLAVTSGSSLALVLLAQISEKETLLVVDIPAPVAAGGRPVMPAGVVKGEPYLLGTDLKGLVNVTSLGAGQFKLERTGQPTLTVTSGKTSASLGGGAVTLPLAPVSDGKNLLFPFSALTSLGCTAAPNGKVLTVACGSNSVGIKPIIF